LRRVQPPPGAQKKVERLTVPPDAFQQVPQLAAPLVLTLAGESV
jgi:hypothetical protein